MNSSVVEFGGVLVNQSGIYLAVVRSEIELTGLTAIGSRNDRYYYVGMARETNAIGTLDYLRGLRMGFVDFDAIRDLLIALPIQLEESWIQSLPEDKSLAELALIIAEGLTIG